MRQALVARTHARTHTRPPISPRVCRPVRHFVFFLLCVVLVRKNLNLESLHVAVALQRGEQQVDHPEHEEKHRRGDLQLSRPSQLAADRLVAAEQHHHYGDGAADAEDGHREGQRARHHLELGTVDGVIDGRYRPGYADAEEDVDGITTRHVTDR